MAINDTVDNDNGNKEKNEMNAKIIISVIII